MTQINHRDDKRRSVLVIDDELINREILNGILKEDYEVFSAADGKKALEIIKENRDTLSLILLDLIMPVLSGRELLKILKEDDETKDIPVIAMSSDPGFEVECLYMGAIDFIPKPYPLKDVILARVNRAILLSEDRAIIEGKLDRVRQAASLLKHKPSRKITSYDFKMYEKELFAQQLIDDFDEGLRNREFEVWYQPKFNIKADPPVLTSAEALLRWNHREKGMIAPMEFIPLFEENGLIQRLDLYVWRSVAEQMKKWKKKLKISVPVSVNVSRLDLYDPDLIKNLKTLIKEAELSPEEMLLEITESAYTQESD